MEKDRHLWPWAQMWPAETQAVSPMHLSVASRTDSPWLAGQLCWDACSKQPLLLPEHSGVKTEGEAQRSPRAPPTLRLLLALQFYGPVTKEQNAGGEPGVSTPHRTGCDSTGHRMCSRRCWGWKYRQKEEQRVKITIDFMESRIAARASGMGQTASKLVKMNTSNQQLRKRWFLHKF